MEALLKVSPRNGDYESWSVWRVINPHVQIVRSYTLLSDYLSEQRAYILTGAGLYHTVQGQYQAADEELREALTTREQFLGPKHPLTLATVLALGYLCWDQNLLTDAEVMYERALAESTAILGPNNSDTLAAVLILGTIYTDQQKWTEAEDLYHRALQGYQKASRPDRPEALKTLYNLGSLCSILGKLAEAEKYYRCALSGYEKIWGPDHFDTLRVVLDLANNDCQQEKLTEAEISYKRALGILEKDLDCTHPLTQQPLRQLRSISRNSEKALKRSS